jgi:hypothetical protein
MSDQLLTIKTRFQQAISQISDLDSLEQLEIQYLGRKAGELTNVLRG